MFINETVTVINVFKSDSFYPKEPEKTLTESDEWGTDWSGITATKKKPVDKAV